MGRNDADKSLLSWSAGGELLFLVFWSQMTTRSSIINSLKQCYKKREALHIIWQSNSRFSEWIQNHWNMGVKHALITEPLRLKGTSGSLGCNLLPKAGPADRSTLSWADFIITEEHFSDQFGSRHPEDSTSIPSLQRQKGINKSGIGGADEPCYLKLGHMKNQQQLYLCTTLEINSKVITSLGRNCSLYAGHATKFFIPW